MLGSSTYSLRTRESTSLYTCSCRYEPSLLEARTPSKPPTAMNSSTAAEEITIAALVFIDIGFDLLWKRNYFWSERSRQYYIFILMLVSACLLRRMTFSNSGSMLYLYLP